MGANSAKYLSMRDGFANLFKKVERKPDKTFWALEGLDFEVYAGDTVGIIGRNGAGKSTLLKILSKITPPTKGSVKLRGRVASLLEVGTGFHQELSGRENIYMNGSILGMRKWEITKRLDEIVDFAGVEKFLDTPVKHYSSGMSVRLAFAVAAHLEPEILIVDEVLAVGDAEFQKKCLGKMSEVSKGEGRTVLFVSHQMNVVSQLCKKGILLKNGKMDFMGDTQKCIDLYLNSVSDILDMRLVDRTDRKGTGDVLFTEFKILNDRNEQISVAVSGETVKFQFIYTKNIKSKDFRSMNFALKICDYLDNNLFYLDTNLSVQDFGVVFDNGKITCTMPNFPLVGGEYHLGICCKLDNVLADNIDHAVRFSVLNGVFFSSGKTHSPALGSMLVKHTWENAGL